MSKATLPGKNLLRIGELSSRTGVSPRLLRYYDNQGLLTAQRSAAGQRLFDQAAVEQVRSIRLLLGAGLPTRIIAELLDCIHEPGASNLAPCRRAPPGPRQAHRQPGQHPYRPAEPHRLLDTTAAVASASADEGILA